MANVDTVSVPPTPTKAGVTAALGAMKPLRRLIQPKVYGIENVPTEREADPNRSVVGRLLRTEA